MRGTSHRYWVRCLTTKGRNSVEVEQENTSLLGGEVSHAVVVEP